MNHIPPVAVAVAMLCPDGKYRTPPNGHTETRNDKARQRLKNKSRSLNLKYASDDLRRDRKVVLTAMLNHPGSLVHCLDEDMKKVGDVGAVGAAGAMRWARCGGCGAVGAVVGREPSGGTQPNHTPKPYLASPVPLRW